MDIREECNKWYDNHISTIKTSDDSCYYYAKLYDGYIFAIGNEWGREGGDLITMTHGGSDGIRDWIERFLKTDLGKTRHGLPDYEAYLLAEKIKGLPIISIDIYNKMCDERMKWPRDCGRYWWYDKVE